MKSEEYPFAIIAQKILHQNNYYIFQQQSCNAEMYPLLYIDLFHNADQVLKFSSKFTKWVFRRVEEALAAAKKMDDQLKKVISCATPERTSCLSKDALTMDDVLAKMMDL